MSWIKHKFLLILIKVILNFITDSAYFYHFIALFFNDLLPSMKQTLDVNFRWDTVISCYRWVFVFFNAVTQAEVLVRRLWLGLYWFFIWKYLLNFELSTRITTFSILIGHSVMFATYQLNNTNLFPTFQDILIVFLQLYFQNWYRICIIYYNFQ